MKGRVWLMLVALAPCALARGEAVIVGSKTFTESYILAEIAAQLLEHHGIEVERRLGLNGTRIAFTALRNEAIDLYPEYSGTIAEVILSDPGLDDWNTIGTTVARRGLRLLPPLGFDNSYAIAVTRAAAERHGLRRISDLRSASGLRIALSHEFLQREDGWLGLKARYGIEQAVRGIEHSLAYEAMENGQLDGTDVYTTDGEIVRSELVLLEDDLDYFPHYRAAYFSRDDLPGQVVDVLGALAGRIDDRRMRELNRSALNPEISIAAVASAFLVDEGLVPATAGASTLLPQLWRNTARHLKLTLIALGLAMAVAVGIAVVVHRHRAAADGFLHLTGLVQTIPSIALLALLIPLFGVGQTPAIIALFLYSLLPIARSTITALHAIPPGYRQVAAAMAMSRRQELRYVLMPLAMPHVLAGIRTAAVISIGTATLAAFIGAGGLGDPIVTGLALNDTSLILQGAVPAACLAIATELLFAGLERRLVPPHMRSARRA